MGTVWHVRFNAARHGRGTAWARHGKCELAFTLVVSHVAADLYVYCMGFGVLLTAVFCIPLAIK
jgi:hypothetical protein